MIFIAILIPESIMDRMNVFDVTDYGAVGDGTTDDTAAIQSAINAQLTTQNRYSSPKFIYFPPNKTYLISDTLAGRVADLTFADGWRAGLILFGIDPDTTIIKLAANATGFGNSASIKPMLITGSESNPPGDDTGTNPTGRGNEAFAHGVYHLTFDLNGNAGAAGVDYLASNRGGIEDCKFTSSTQTGIGIYMSRGNQGPCLVSSTTIENCAYGIRTLDTAYNVTISNVTVRNQGTAGIEVNNGTYAIEGLKSYNNVPAVKQISANGFVSIQNSELRLHTGQSRSALYGIEAAGRIEVQNLGSNAYDNPVRSTRNGTVNVAESGLPTINGLPTVKRFTTFSNRSLFVSSPQPLPVRQAPDSWNATATNWAVYGDYGGVGTLQQLQNTIDAGREFVALPQGGYTINGDLFIRGIKKLHGFQSSITAAVGTTPTIYFDSGGSSDFTVLEHIYITGCKIVHRSTDALHLKHNQLNDGYENTSAGTGNLFFSDVLSPPTKIQHGQKAWFRQLNTEFETIQLEITDSTVWICGMKTENTGSVAQRNIKATRSSIQVSGATFYALGSAQNGTIPKTPSIELIDCKNALLSWNCFNATSGVHDIQVRETIGSVTRELLVASLSSPSPTCVSYSGGKQSMQEIFSARAPYSTTTVQTTTNPATYAAVANAGFVAKYNPNGYTFSASTGQVTVTGSDLGGTYRVDMDTTFLAAGGALLLSTANRADAVYGATTLQAFCSQDSASSNNVGASGFDHFTIPAGTTSFTLQPKYYAITNPIPANLNPNGLNYALIYVGV